MMEVIGGVWVTMMENSSFRRWGLGQNDGRTPGVGQCISLFISMNCRCDTDHKHKTFLFYFIF